VLDRYANIQTMRQACGLRASGHSASNRLIALSYRLARLAEPAQTSYREVSLLVTFLFASPAESFKSSHIRPAVSS
jgi:hypothetical protein